MWNNANQLSLSQEMVTDYAYAIEHNRRLIGYIDHNWYIDLPIEDIRSHWKLWELAKQMLFQLLGSN